MEKLQNILRSFRDFMPYGLFDSDTINIAVGTMLAIVITLFLATYLLKWIHKVVTSKLPEADKNRFVSIFGFTDSFSDPKLKSQIRYRIDSRFRENNISIPSPQRDVHLFQHTASGASHIGAGYGK